MFTDFSLCSSLWGFHGSLISYSSHANDPTLEVQLVLLYSHVNLYADPFMATRFMGPDSITTDSCCRNRCQSALFVSTSFTSLHIYNEVIVFRNLHMNGRQPHMSNSSFSWFSVLCINRVLYVMLIWTCFSCWFWRQMLPTVAYSDNPSTSFAAKFVHTSLNKNRCSINRVLVRLSFQLLLIWCFYASYNYICLLNSFSYNYIGQVLLHTYESWPYSP